MPWAVTRKQTDGTRLYLKGASDIDIVDAMWTPSKADAMPISSEEKGELIVRLLGLFGSADYELIGHNKDSDDDDAA